MSNEQYDKMDGTYRQWRKDQGLRVRDMNNQNTSAPSPTAKKAPKGSASKPEGINIGDKCVDRDQRRAGVVRFVGTTSFGSGWWVGVEFELPLGKNDGTVEGVKYFECSPKHGSFLPGEKVDVVCHEGDGHCEACHDHKCEDC